MKSFPILLSVSGDADGVVLRGACKLFRLPSLRRLSPHDNFLFQCIFSRTLGVCVSELWMKQRVTVERVSAADTSLCSRLIKSTILVLMDLHKTVSQHLKDKEIRADAGVAQVFYTRGSCC